MNALSSKSKWMVPALLFLIEARCPGQSPSSVSTRLSYSNRPDFVCIQRGPNSRVWQRSVIQQNADGSTKTNTQSYTELHSGVCYQKNGQWVDSVEEIKLSARGARAVRGAYQAEWAGNINTPNGALRVTSPTGQLFSSTVFGLSYRDASTGTNVLIAPLQDSIGEVVGKNQAVYTNAFSGLNADILYTYKMEGIDQNIVLREQPPSPARFNLNPETTFFEVVTKFYDAPAAIKRTVSLTNVIDDQVLRFSDMLMGQGVAFLVKDENQSQRHSLRVTKHWVPQEDGSAILYEEVPYTALTNMVSALPLHSSNVQPANRIRRTASFKPSSQKPSAGAQVGESMKLTRNENNKKPGFVIDYMLINPGYDSANSNFVFQGDTTYYVKGQWYYVGSGTVVFEGGTVIKYTNSATIFNYGTTPGVFDGATYSPSVFTAWNDNSVGTPLTGSPGALTPVSSSTCYVEAEEGTSTNVISNARFSYNDYAYTDYTHHYFVFRDCQFVECISATATKSAYSVAAKNILCCGCSNLFAGYGSETINAENITVDSCPAFALTNSWWGPCAYSGGITNSILTACDQTTSLFTTQDVVIATSGSGIYQTVGAGSYYLTTNSPYVNTGTINIDPYLLEDLQTKTTYPPVVLSPSSGTLSTNITLFPQALRDSDTPDLGYHYDPVDYALNIEVSNAVITVLPGTALATYGAEYGIWLYTNGVINSTGTATSPNYFVRYNTVQEQSNTNWESTAWEGSLATPLAMDNSSANFTFTDWSALASDVQFYSSGIICPVTFQNCQIYGGQFLSDGPNIVSTNCLYRRVGYEILALSASVNFYNNLFLDGALTYRYNTSLDTWSFRDNLFDQTAITNQSNHSVAVCSNNAYVTTNFGVITPENNDVILGNSPAYEIGDLGQYYYPTGLTDLIYKGSELASAVGLNNYTVTTNNTTDGTNIVSIGFHYPTFLSITAEPVSQSVTAGSSTTLAVTASGTGPLSYQWYRNGVPISDETNSSLSFSPATSEDAGSYNVVVSNTLGIVTSWTATLKTAPNDFFVNYWSASPISSMLRGAFGLPDFPASYREPVIQATAGGSMRGVAGGIDAETYNWMRNTSQQINQYYADGYSGDGTSLIVTTLEMLENARDNGAALIFTVNTRGDGYLTNMPDSNCWHTIPPSTNFLEQMASNWVRYVNFIAPNYRWSNNIIVPVGGAGPISASDSNAVANIMWTAGNGTNLPFTNLPTLLSVTDTNTLPTPKVMYWEIGNELDGLMAVGSNGFDPTETNVYDLTADEYDSRYKTITAAMLSADPTIKVGPGFVYGWNNPFLTTLLGDTTAQIDFVVYHPYGPANPSTFWDALSTMSTNLEIIKMSQDVLRNSIYGAFVTERHPFTVPLLATEWNDDTLSGNYSADISMWAMLGDTETVLSMMVGQQTLAADYWYSANDSDWPYLFTRFHSHPIVG
jgi:hypothetical protein